MQVFDTPQGTDRSSKSKSAQVIHTETSSILHSNELSVSKRLALSLGSLPTNLGWAISEALLIPYLLETGCPMFACSWAWLLSPILAAKFGPIIDRWTDSHDTNCCGWRGRKQMILTFSILSAIIMFCIPRSTWISNNIFNTNHIVVDISIIIILFSIMDTCHYLILRILSSLIWIITMGNTDSYISVMRTYNIVQVMCRMLGCIIAAVCLEWIIFGTYMNHITSAWTLGSISVVVAMFCFVLFTPNEPEIININENNNNSNNNNNDRNEVNNTNQSYVDEDEYYDETDPLHPNNSQFQPMELMSHAHGWDVTDVNQISNREAADQRIMASIGDMSREEIEYNKAGYYWLVMTQFTGWLTVSTIVIFWTSFTGIDVYHGNPTASYGSRLLKDFENGVNFGVFGLLLKAVVSVNTSLVYPWIARCFSTRTLFIMGESIMAIVCVLVFFFKSDITLLILIAIFGFGMQLHLQTCPEFNDGEFRSLYDNTMRTDGSLFKYLLESGLIIAPVTVALLGGPVADAINDEFRWIFLIPGLLMFIMNAVLVLIFLNIMPKLKLPPPKVNNDVYEHETYLP